MPALDLALGLRMIGRTAHVRHASIFEPFCKISGDVARSVVATSPIRCNWHLRHPDAHQREWCTNRVCSAGDTARAATSDEVKALRRETQDLKEVVAEQALELRLLKKSVIADGGDEA